MENTGLIILCTTTQTMASLTDGSHPRPVSGNMQLSKATEKLILELIKNICLVSTGAGGKTLPDFMDLR